MAAVELSGGGLGAGLRRSPAERPRVVVLRFRLDLESLGLAAATINQRLAAVRRLAYEAADSGLLSPELAFFPGTPLS